MVIIHTDTFFPTVDLDDWHFLSERVEGSYKALVYVAQIEGGYLVAEQGTGYDEAGVRWIDDGLTFLPDGGTDKHERELLKTHHRP